MTKEDMMSADWPYAKIVKEMSEAGGPEKYLETLVSTSREAGRLDGRMDMVPWIGVATVVAAAGTWGYMKIRDWFKTEREKKEERLENAKQDAGHVLYKYSESPCVCDEGGEDDEQEI